MPRFVEPGNDRHAEIVDYMAAVTAEAGLNARYRVESEMVVLEAAA